MPDTPSITIIKKFNYRGQNEEFSNTYHFSGTQPANAAAWEALADAIIAAEKLTVTNSITFVRAYGYNAGVDDSVAQIDYTLAPRSPQAGTYSPSAGVRMPGDVAATTRWYTGASSHGKKIYARKYGHGVYSGSSGGDDLYSQQLTLFNTFAAKLIDGTLPGSFKYCGPQGAVLQTGETSPYLTTRTLKRRGKRPPTSS